MNAGRSYFPPTFDRHRHVLRVPDLGVGVGMDAAPAVPAPYLKVLHSLADRSLLAGLRMHPSVRGLNVGGPPVPGSPVLGATDVPALTQICCPLCRAPNMSYAHALQCTKFAQIRQRFQLDNGLNLHACLLHTDKSHLQRLCGFVRLVRGLTENARAAGKRVWRTHLDAFPPKDPLPPGSQSTSQRLKCRPTRDIPSHSILDRFPLPEPFVLPPGKAPKDLEGYEKSAYKFQVPLAMITQAEDRAKDPTTRQPMTKAARAYLQEITNAVLIATYLTKPNLPEYEYPSAGQCIPFMYAAGFLYGQKQVEARLQHQRNGLKSKPGAAALLEKLRADKQIPEQ